jgi:hypothetical protein
MHLVPHPLNDLIRPRPVERNRRMHALVCWQVLQIQVPSSPFPCLHEISSLQYYYFSAGCTIARGGLSAVINRHMQLAFKIRSM